MVGVVVRQVASGFVALAVAAGLIVGAASSASATVENTGQRDTSFTPPELNDSVRSMAELKVGAQAGKYLVAGTCVGDPCVPGTDWLARLNTDGSRDTSFTPLALEDGVHSVTELTQGAHAGKYLIGGAFQDAGGDAATDYVARLNVDGSRDTTFTPPALNTVYSVTELTQGTQAGKYLIGGNFQNAGGDTATDYVARLNSDGSRDETFTPMAFNSIVYSVTELRGAQAGKYLIGGLFLGAGLTHMVARLNEDGSRDTSFTPPTLNATVFSATELVQGPQAGKYLIGGLFQNAGGDAATDYVARLNADGSRDTSFTPVTLNSSVRSVAELSDGKYLIGGLFQNAGGDAATDYVARLNANGSRDASFTPLTLNNYVYSVTELVGGAQAGKYLIGGSFLDAGGNTATDRVARLGETVTPPNPPAPPTPVPPSSTKAKQHLRAGSFPAKIKSRGTTVLNKRNATTRERRPLKARARVVSNRGEVRCFRLIKGKQRKLTIRTYGKCNLRIRVTYTAPGNSAFYGLKRVKTYRVKV